MLCFCCIDAWSDRKNETFDYKTLSLASAASARLFASGCITPAPAGQTPLPALTNSHSFCACGVRVSQISCGMVFLKPSEDRRGYRILDVWQSPYLPGQIRCGSMPGSAISYISSVQASSTFLRTGYGSPQPSSNPECWRSIRLVA